MEVIGSLLTFCDSTCIVNIKKNMFTVEVLSQKVNKLPVTYIDLLYIVTKTTSSMKNPKKHSERE